MIDSTFSHDTAQVINPRYGNYRSYGVFDNYRKYRKSDTKMSVINDYRIPVCTFEILPALTVGVELVSWQLKTEQLKCNDLSFLSKSTIWSYAQCIRYLELKILLLQWWVPIYWWFFLLCLSLCDLLVINFDLLQMHFFSVSKFYFSYENILKSSWTPIIIS